MFSYPQRKQWKLSAKKNYKLQLEKLYTIVYYRVNGSEIVGKCCSHTFPVWSVVFAFALMACDCDLVCMLQFVFCICF